MMVTRREETNEQMSERANELPLKERSEDSLPVQDTTQPASGLLLRSSSCVKLNNKSSLRQTNPLPENLAVACNRASQ